MMIDADAPSRRRAHRRRRRRLTPRDVAGGVGAVLLSVWYATLRNAELTPSARALVVAVRRSTRARARTRTRTRTRTRDEDADPTRARSNPNPQAPIYAVVAFALYSVVVIARGVIWFPTCEAEAEALARDVARARRELAKRGVRVHDDDDEREDAKPTSRTCADARASARASTRS